MDRLDLPLAIAFMELVTVRGFFFEPSTSRDLVCQVHRNYDTRLNLNRGNEVENLSLIQTQKRQDKLSDADP
jgi:hypothetical protein